MLTYSILLLVLVYSLKVCNSRLYAGTLTLLDLSTDPCMDLQLSRKPIIRRAELVALSKVATQVVNVLEVLIHDRLR